MALTISQTALAATGNTSYVTGSTSYRQPIPVCYVVNETINNIGDFEDKNTFFKKPQDIFIDKNDYVYIVDGGNKRVVKMNEKHETVGIYYGPDKAFNNPQGIYVDDDGDMYVADTDNKRIVHMDPDGNLVELFTNPNSELETGDTFSPTKLIVNQTGYMYIVRGENIMAIDGNGEFRGYYGQTNIGYSLTEALMRIFASEEQRLKVTKRLASSYINLTLGDDGMIYATSLERTEGEIKKLNSVGTNIYRKYTTVASKITNPITSFINNKILKTVVAGRSFRFGEYFDDDGMYQEPVFADICVDQNGVVTVLEQNTGHIYQYDQSGNMLVGFAGLGTTSDKFSRPVALDVDSKGNIYVLDLTEGSVKIFKPTEFIGLIHDATLAFNNGDYEASYDLWQEVLQIDENYDLAHIGIAKTYYKRGEYKLSMEESKLVGDRDVYTSAFDEYKYVVLRAYFGWILLLAAAIIAAVIVLFVFFMKKANKAYWDYLENKDKKMSVGRGIMYNFYAIFHPVDSLEGIRYNRSRINMVTPFLMLLIAYIVRMAYLYIVHFPLASIELKDVNPVFEAVKLWIVPLTWIPATFAATSISGGESKIPEITFTSAMSLAPFILINVPLMFLSNIWSKSQASWYGAFSTLAYILMFLILFQALRILNNYTFGKTIGMMFVSAVMMVVIWLVALLCYILAGRMIQFVISIIEEFRLNFL